MKFGVREICDVVLKAKAAQKVGNKLFYKNEPVIYFDTLKTSTMEGAATTVYAQGGRGNSRLVAWEGERTITFTMEDALISPAGFMILSGAGLINAGDVVNGKKQTLKVHTTEQTDLVKVTDDIVEVTVSELPYFLWKNDKNELVSSKVRDDNDVLAAEAKMTAEDGLAIDQSDDYIYVMVLDNGEVSTEPFIPTHIKKTIDNEQEVYKLILNNKTDNKDDISYFKPERQGDLVVLVDYYVEKESGAQQIDITPDKFGGNYYLEASTLFRDTNGVDMPAEFIIPNCKIQSNFTFTMASSGDPSTFTFTMDAFPDYTRFDRTKKVLAAIQIVNVAGTDDTLVREKTFSALHNKF
jgi:hypothetical protein